MHRSNNVEDYRAGIQQLFNFSFVQQKRQSEDYRPSLTSDEKRGLGMWATTVLQPYGDQFVHALKHSRQLSIGQLNLYILKHYSHLQTIIRYFVIGSLIDYSKVGSQSQIEKECIFLNMVIEELACRFFRESQWLQKISHLTAYHIFSVFDTYSKGYTCLRQIQQTISTCLKGSKHLVKHRDIGKYPKNAGNLLRCKLSRNLPETDPAELRIYLQNIIELMNRANLIAFESLLANQDNNPVYSRYLQIHREIARFNQILTERHRISQSEELARSRREQQELELMRQDFKIKQESDLITRKDFMTQRSRPSGLQVTHLNRSEHCAATPYSTQFIKHPLSEYSTNHINFSLNQKHQQMVKPRSGERYVSSVGSRKQNLGHFQNQCEGQALFSDLLKIQTNKTKLAMRNTIMSELQAVRHQRRRNHLQLLQYI